MCLSLISDFNSFSQDQWAVLFIFILFVALVAGLSRVNEE